MSFTIRTRIDGLALTLKALGQLKQGARNSVLRPAIGAAAGVVARAAKRNIAARVKERTGQLKRSIGSVVRLGRKPGTVYAVVGPRSGFKTTYRGENVDPLNYAHLVELGTAAHAIPITKGPFAGITWHHPGTQPKPFLRPALEDNRDRIRAVMAAKIRQRLEILAAKSLKRGHYARAAFAGSVAQAIGVGQAIGIEA